MKDCKDCVNYKKVSCPFLDNEYIRIYNIEDYDFDCFQSEWDKMMCDMMCGKVEKDE